MIYYFNWKCTNDTDNVNVDIDDHIKDETFIDDFDCPEKFNTAVML